MLKMKKKLQILILSLSALAGGGFSLTAQADVMGFVESHKIPGQVLSHVVSHNGKFVYAASTSPGKIYVFSRNQEYGKLTELQAINPPSSVSTFSSQGMVISPDDKQLYILNLNGDVLRFDVNDMGELTYVGSIETAGRGSGIVISSNGSYLYVAGYYGELTVLRRAANGNLSKKQLVTKDLNDNEISYAKEMTLSPDGKQLFVSSPSFDDRLYVFNIETGGTLTSTQVFMNKNNSYNPNDEDIKIDGAGGYGTAVTKDGKYFYAVGRTRSVKDSISIFKRDGNGRLSFYKNVVSPKKSATNSNTIIFSPGADLIISPNQKYVYVFDDITDILSVWRRDIKTGDLSLLDRINGISSTHYDYRMNISPDEKHLYLNATSGIVVYDLRSDLNIVKSGPSTNVAPNGTISYTLAVTNNGPSDAYNVVATDTLPAGTSYISGTVNSASGSCSASDQKVTCSMGKFAVDDGYNAIIQVKAPTAEGTITNTASVTADQLDSKTTDNSDSVTTTIKKGGSTLPPVTGGGTGGSGGGSMPLSLFVLLLPALLRRRLKFN